MAFLMKTISILFVLIAACTFPEPQTIRMSEGNRHIGAYVSPSAYYHYLLARIAFERKLYGEACDELRLAISSDPKSEHLHFRLAEGLYADGRKEEAISELNEAIRLNPECVEATQLRQQWLHGTKE